MKSQIQTIYPKHLTRVSLLYCYVILIVNKNKLIRKQLKQFIENEVQS